MTQHVVKGTHVSMKPTHLYKYRTLDNVSLSYVEQTIRQNEIYFTSPAQFNDPFDCKVHWSFKTDDSIFRKYYHRLLKDKIPDLKDKERQLRVEEWIKSGKHLSPTFHEELMGEMQKKVDQLGVFCLTEKRDDILMWAHYAGSHSGVCLEFKASAGPFSQVERVNYRDEYPDVDILLDAPNLHVDAIFFTKAIFWKYEQEWRIIDREGGHGIKRLNNDLLTGVILGCNINDNNRRLILQWIKERSCSTKLYEAKLKKDSFGLDIFSI